MQTALDTYRQLGTSGLFVSPLCLGTMSFGEEWGWGAPEADAVGIMDRYLDAGGNFVDTADVYTNGTSERIVGRALARDGKRHRVVLATKGTLNFALKDPNAGGNSRAHLARAIDASLVRLGTDYIDLYWVHMFDGATPVAETLRALDDAVRAGKVRYVGLSNYPVRKVVEWQLLARHHALVPAVAAQFEYNLLTRAIELEHVPAFEQFGIGQVPWGPLAQGVLSGRYTRENRKPPEHRRAGGEMQQARLTDRAFAIIDEIGAVALELGTTHPHVALTWLRERPTVVAPIVGCRTVAHLDDLIASLALEIPLPLLARLEAASAPDTPYPWSFMGVAAAGRAIRGGATTELFGTG